MKRYGFAASAVLVLLVSSASAQAPPPIKLLLTPARPPTPALRYQLLPDARVRTSGDAAAVYKEVIELLAKTPVTPKASLFNGWTEEPVDRFPTKEARKELAEFDKVFELLDKAARCDH